MRLNQNEEDLFNELENIEFDFSLDDDLNNLNKKEKELVIKELEKSEDSIRKIEKDDENKNKSE